MNVNQLIIDFLKQEKGYLIAYAIFMFAYPMASVWLPKFYGEIMEDIKEGKDPKFLATFIVMVLVNVMYGTLDKMDTVFIPKLQAYIRNNIVKVVLNNYKDKFQEQELGILISKIVKLPIVVRDLVYQIRGHIVPLIMVLFFVIIRFIMIDRFVGTIALSGIIAIVTTTLPRMMHCLNMSKTMDTDVDTVHESISELFDNILNIYSANTIDDEIDKLERDQTFTIKKYNETFSCVNSSRSIMNLMTIVLFVTLIYYAFKRYKAGTMQLDNVIAIAVTSMYVISKVGSFSGEIPDIIFDLGVYHRINEYLSQLNENGNTKELYVNQGDIKFENVGVKYGDKEVVQNFDLHVQPGETVGIIGKIGSGKSSLIKALLMLHSVNEGCIRVDDQDISSINPISLRSQFVFVPQNPIPFNRTLLDNITYGNKNVSRQDVENIFNEYDLKRFFGEMQLDDMIGRKGSHLSGGMKTMLFLLRVMISKDKKVILLDEPTAALDDGTCDIILPIIKKIGENRTMIIITHDYRVTKILDRIVRLK